MLPYDSPIDELERPWWSLWRVMGGLLYLLLGFPTGLLYFLLLTIVLSLGFGLLPILIGIPILLGTVPLVNACVAFERMLALTLLDARIAPVPPPNPAGNWLKSTLRQFVNPDWLRGLVFLGLKFPLGMLSFTLALTLLVSVVALFFGPLVALALPGSVTTVLGIPQETTADALVLFVFGVILLPIFVASTAAGGWLWRVLAEFLLSGPTYPAQDDVLHSDAVIHLKEKPRRKNDDLPPGYVYDPYSDTIRPRKKNDEW